MRGAKFKDYWRKVNTRTPAHSAITELSYNDEDYLLTNLHVVSGQNGSGKSSLLKHFVSSSSVRPPIFENVRVERQLSNLVGQSACKFQYTSPSWLVEENVRRINNLRAAGQFDEYISGIESFSFSDGLLEFVNYVLNTSFTDIELYETEKAEEYNSETSRGLNLGATEEIVLENAARMGEEQSFSDDILEDKAFYIKTSINEDDVTSIPLSQGEQYIILIIYLLSTRKGYAVLIDEPETYLSPLSQYRLADVLAYYSVENRLQFILATHSICFIEKVPAQSTLMLDGVHCGKFNLATGKKVTSHLRRLGYKVPKENIALFEDEKAKRLFANIARDFDADWLASMELVSLNGESDITAIIDRVKSYRLTAIYDADQKGKTDPKKYQGQHHVTFLPGSLAPEMELIASLKKNNVSFANRLSIKQVDLDVYMRMIEGIDHHDYFSHFADITGIDKWRLFDEAFAIWSGDNRHLIEEFLKEFA